MTEPALDRLQRANSRLTQLITNLKGAEPEGFVRRIDELLAARVSVTGETLVPLFLQLDDLDEALNRALAITGHLL